MEKTILIGCGIFQEEMEWILKKEGLDLEMDWREVGLHDNIERMEAVLDETIRAHRSGPDQTAGRPLGLLFGRQCLPEMKVFAQSRNVPVLPARNCLAALVGDDRLRELEQDRTLVASPGWVRKMWLGRADTPTGWRADDFRLQFGRYDRILVLDPGIHPLTDEEIITCFDLVQVPIEIMPCDLTHFRQVVLDLVQATQSPAPAQA